MKDIKYTKEFYRIQQPGSLQAARTIVPLVAQLIKPKSVVDVGCGTGTFLSVFRENGIEDILGIDGNYVDRNMLLIPKEYFLPQDITKSFKLGRRFDLVVSLEVAEHLPAHRAEGFVNNLTELGPVVLFSAAIPFQGGVEHVNEQWPEYWASHFFRKGYLPLDCIRKRIWNIESVRFHYAQNIIIFCERDYIKNNPPLQEEFDKTASAQLSIVHPKQYIATRRNLVNSIKIEEISLKKILKGLPSKILKTAAQKTKGRLSKNNE